MKNTSIESLTLQMNSLESVINTQQKYILKWGDHNDKNTDSQWEEYKRDAKRNLQLWEELKAKRNQLKAA